MDLILNEAEVETNSLKFDSDDEDEMEFDSTPLSEDEDFLTCYEDEYIEEEDPSFYRTFDNREEFANFENQTKDPVKSSKRSEKNYYGEDDLPELFAPEDRKKVNFHSFSKDKERALNLKKAFDVLFQSKKISFFMRYYMD